MLLGVSFMLFRIYVRCLFIEHLSDPFAEFIWVLFPLIGFLIVLYGFFSGNREETLTEKNIFSAV